MKKRLAVLVLAFAMVLTMSVGVFADSTPKDNKAGAYLTSTLKIAEGITVPSGTLTYKFTPTVANEEGAVADTTTYPAMSSITVGYSSEDRAADGTDVELTKTSALTFPTNFPKSGVYAYTVSQEYTGFTTAEGETFTPDTKTYVIKFYVKNGTAGQKTIDNVEIVDGTDKIDATKTDSDENTDADKDGDATNDGNDFKFVNVFTKEITHNPGVDPEDPDDPAKDGAFVLTKAIEGGYAGVDDVFKFDVTVDYPDTFTGSKTSTGDFVGTFADNTKVEVSLKGGQSMKFASLPSGTKITVVEKAFENYTAVAATKAGTNGTGAIDGTATGTKDQGVNAGTLLVAQYGARADVTNTFDQVTPTGIIINNLPYVLLIGLALGGIVLFSRKRRYE